MSGHVRPCQALKCRFRRSCRARAGAHFSQPSAWNWITAAQQACRKQVPSAGLGPPRPTSGAVTSAHLSETFAMYSLIGFPALSAQDAEGEATIEQAEQPKHSDHGCQPHDSSGCFAADEVVCDGTIKVCDRDRQAHHHSSNGGNNAELPSWVGGTIRAGWGQCIRI